MILATWTTWRHALGWGISGARRRTVKARGSWGIETERMENRALLSAVGGLDAIAPVAAEVAAADPKASFTYPNVAGSWTVTGDATGDATLTQTKNKVNSTITAMGLNVSMKGHFTKAHPHELSGTAHVPNIITGHGKLAVKVHIDFGEGTDPTTFTGEVTIVKLGMTLHVSGSKTGGAAVASHAAPSAKTAPMYPDVSGLWDISADVPEFGLFQGPLNVTQNNGKISAEATLSDGVTVQLKGKINKHDLTHIKGKAHIQTPIPGFTKVNAPFELDLSDNNTHFSGHAHTKIGEVGLDGVRPV